MMSPDGHAIIDRLDPYAGLLAWRSGTNFKTAPAIGRCVAEWITEGAPRNIDLHAFRASRFAEGRLCTGNMSTARPCRAFSASALGRHPHESVERPQEKERIRPQWRTTGQSMPSQASRRFTLTPPFVSRSPTSSPAYGSSGALQCPWSCQSVRRRGRASGDGRVASGESSAMPARALMTSGTAIGAFLFLFSCGRSRMFS